MYNREKAVLYAKEWAFKINPQYYDFTMLGGDCTNFVSQCLCAGLGEMDYYNWFYQNLNKRSPSWTGVEEFWEYGINNNNFSGFKISEISLNDVEIGDVIQLYNPLSQSYYHNLIVTKTLFPINIQNVLVSAHDQNSYNRSLSDYQTIHFRVGKITNNFLLVKK